MTPRPLHALLPLALGVLLLAVPALAADAPPPGSGTVGELAKTHNVDLSDGRLGLRLVVPTTVANLKGSKVVCVVFFADDRGAYVPSRRPEHAGPDGSIRLLSPDREVESNPAALDFTFTVPYDAFPRREPGRYRVEARARLVLRASGGNVVLAQGTTRFWVEG